MEFTIYDLEHVPLYYHEMLKAIAAVYSYFPSVANSGKGPKESNFKCVLHGSQVFPENAKN